MFRLLIVDDEYYVRVGIKSAIDWSEIGVEVVGEAADGEEALEMALSSRYYPYRRPHAVYGRTYVDGAA